MAFIDQAGARLYFEEAGSGYPIVFVHEFGADLREWELQMRAFSRFYRCIAFNARGYPPSAVAGRSGCNTVGNSPATISWPCWTGWAWPKPYRRAQHGRLCRRGFWPEISRTRHGPGRRRLRVRLAAGASGRISSGIRWPMPKRFARRAAPPSPR